MWLSVDAMMLSLKESRKMASISRDSKFIFEEKLEENDKMNRIEKQIKSLPTSSINFDNRFLFSYIFMQIGRQIF